MRGLGRFTVRRRWWILAASLVTLVTTVLVALNSMSAFSLSRFQASGTESLRAAQVLDREFATGSPNMILLVTARGPSVDAPVVAALGQALTRELAGQRGVAEASSYWSRRSTPVLRSGDGRHALVVSWIPGSATEARAVIRRLSPRFTREYPAATVRVGGRDELFRQVGAQLGQDFVDAEYVIFPLVFLLLLLVLRSLVAAVIPLVVSVLAVSGTMTLLYGLTAFVEISAFSLNVALVMGLGLGVDYCLFLVKRFREELAAGHQVGPAVERTVATAGRTVLFSGLTVAASVATLLLFPFPFLNSFGYTGVGVVLFAMAASVVTLPALLAVLGPAVNRGVPWPLRPVDSRQTPLTSGFWYRSAMRVMGRPVAFGTAAVVLLLALGSPVLRLTIGLPDDRILPASASSRQVQQVIRDSFGQEETDALQIVTGPAATRPELTRYAARLSRVTGVRQVDTAFGSFRAGRPSRGPEPGAVTRFTSPDGRRGWVSVVPESWRLDADPYGLVADVRAVPATTGALVGGYPAELTDFRAALLDRLPLVATVIVLATLALLFLMTGSVLLPVKATVLNLLSLSVMYGALVWVFQDGHLAGLLGFTPTGWLEPSFPILMFCVAYGLSMDYEVFMLSRIAEEYRRTGDTVRATAVGLERSAPLVTAAAVILAASFAVYTSAEVLYLKVLGLGMALAVLVDATVVRAVLLPALMRLAGRGNWWAPRPLRRLHDRIGLREEPVEEPAGTPVEPAPALAAPP